MIRIGIVGIGRVGSTTAFLLSKLPCVDKLVLIDPETERAKGIAMDITDGTAFHYGPIAFAGGYSDIRDCDYVVVTAGTKPDTRPGATRLSGMKDAFKIVESIASGIKDSGFSGRIIIASNPLDTMTYAMWRLTGFPRHKVIGTGTSLDTARYITLLADRLGIDEFHAGVLPTDKANIVESLKAQGAKVLVVGDGVNDSPALSASHVGATLRDGADIAQEVADVVLTQNSLNQLPQSIELGRATMRRIRQNFIASVVLNGAFLAGGLSGRLTPALGALLHNGTTIGVCLNAMRDPRALGLECSSEDLSEAIRNGLRYAGTIFNAQEGSHHGR